MTNGIDLGSNRVISEHDLRSPYIDDYCYIEKHTINGKRYGIKIDTRKFLIPHMYDIRSFTQRLFRRKPIESNYSYVLGSHIYDIDWEKVRFHINREISTLNEGEKQ